MQSLDSKPVVGTVPGWCVIPHFLTASCPRPETLTPVLGRWTRKLTLTAFLL